jgi:putative peptidoglycan lipid II flippase
MSEEFAQDRKDNFIAIFNKSFQQITFLVLPLMMIFIVLRVPIVRLTFGVGQNGEYGFYSTQLTAWALLFFSIGILSQSLLSLAVRAFYAIHDTATPLKISIVALVTNVALSLYLIEVFGRFNVNIPFFQNFTTISLNQWNAAIGSQAVGGLALSTTIAVSINFLLLLFMLNRRMHFLNNKKFWLPLLKKFLSAICMLFIMYILFKSFDLVANTAKTLQEFLLFVSVSIVGCIVYVVIEHLLEDEDIKILYKVWKYAKRFIILIGRGEVLPTVVAVQENNNINENQ